jgi:hypothetical protein
MAYYIDSVQIAHLHKNTINKGFLSKLVIQTGTMGSPMVERISTVTISFNPRKLRIEFCGVLEMIGR